jgi:hypothetical protein
MFPSYLNTESDGALGMIINAVAMSIHKQNELIEDMYKQLLPGWEFKTLEGIESAEKDYPHTCPFCQGPSFNGLNKVDCKNNCQKTS